MTFAEPPTVVDLMTKGQEQDKVRQHSTKPGQVFRTFDTDWTHHFDIGYHIVGIETDLIISGSLVVVQGDGSVPRARVFLLKQRNRK